MAGGGGGGGGEKWIFFSIFLCGGMSQFNFFHLRVFRDKNERTRREQR